MQIDRIYYPTHTLGYGQRISIWTVGCPRRCPNCSNPELQESNIQCDVPVSEIISIIRHITSPVDGVTITGGEPFLQAQDLLDMVRQLKHIGIDDILIYSGYSIDELRTGRSEWGQILKLTGVLIDGPYVDQLNDNKSIRGSSNQRIHILNTKLQDRYQNVDAWERKSELVDCGGLLISIGVPNKTVVTSN